MNIITKSDVVLRAHVKHHRVEYLVSVAFFIGGGYFLYHLIGIITNYTVSASMQDWVEALPGMIVMLIFALLISWPGMYMAMVDTLIIDLQLGIIVRRKELAGLHTRGKVIGLCDVGRVVCRQKTRSQARRTVGSTSTTSASVTCYIVDLQLKNGQQAEMREYAERNAALDLARAVAEFTGIPLDDRS